MPRIDPLQMAQFFALPGAAELVEAFSAIPPGELRDSAVSHVQVLARHSGWVPDTPFGVGQPERLAPSAAPKRLASPFSEDLKSASAEGQMIERALRGEASASIAADLGCGVGLIERLKNKARKEGGLVFPGDTASKPGKAKAKGRKNYVPDKMPVPPPPYWWEDPASPIWENGKLLPHYSDKADGSMAGLGPLDVRSYTTMSNAAARNGMTLRQYLAQRFEIIRRVDRGEKPTQVAIDLRINAFAVYSLLTKVGRGRMAEGVAAHYAAEAVAVKHGAPEVAKVEPVVEATVLPPAKPGNRNGPASALAARIAAAKKWGFESLDAYEAARVQVRDLRLKGIGPKEIGEQMKQPNEFVRAAMSYWRGLGVEWPEPTFSEQVQPVDRKRHANRPEHLAMTALSAKMFAAKKWGFPSLDAFEAARLTVRKHRLDGARAARIAEQTGLTYGFVKAALAYWRSAGETWDDSAERAA